MKWIEVCKIYEDIKCGFLELGHDDERAGRDAANILAAVIITAQMDGKARTETSVTITRKGV